MNSQVDRIVLKYAEAEEEFNVMSMAAQRTEEIAYEIETESNKAMEYWKGTDADAYLESINKATSLLKERAEGLQQIVQLLRQHAQENYEKEMNDAAQIASMGM